MRYKYQIDNKLTCTFSTCLIFALLDYFLKRYIQLQQNKECKHHIKPKHKTEFFFANVLKFGKVQMGHLHTCPLHLKFISTTSLSHMSDNEQTRDNTFDSSQLKNMLLNFSDYLI